VAIKNCTGKEESRETCRRRPRKKGGKKNGEEGDSRRGLAEQKEDMTSCKRRCLEWGGSVLRTVTRK